MIGRSHNIYKLCWDKELMKKNTKKIFVIVMMIGVFLSFITYSLMGNECGSACDKHSFFNPLGLGSGELESCTQQCVYTPHPAFYIIFDLLIITAIAYGIMYLQNRFD